MDLMMAVVGTAACSAGVAAAATAATTSTTAASDAPSTAFATDGGLVGVVARIARHLGCQAIVSRQISRPKKCRSSLLSLLRRSSFLTDDPLD